MSWILWFCLVALLVAPVVAVFVEDRPPRNEITQEQENEPRKPAEMTAA